MRDQLFRPTGASAGPAAKRQLAASARQGFPLPGEKNNAFERTLSLLGNIDPCFPFQTNTAGIDSSGREGRSVRSHPARGSEHTEIPVNGFRATRNAVIWATNVRF